MELLSFEGGDHPDGLLLTVEEVRDEVARDDVVSCIGCSSYGTFLSDEYLEGVEESRDDLSGISYLGLFLDLAELEIFAEAVLRYTTELEDTFGDLIDLLCSFVVHLLELAVEGVELTATDVPVVATEVGIVDLEVLQELVQFLDDLLCLSWFYPSDL